MRFIPRTPSSGTADRRHAKSMKPEINTATAETVQTGGSQAVVQEPLVSPPIDRHQKGMPSHKCIIEIWVDGEWLECEWHPRTEDSKADDGYLGTARTTSRPIRIGFHAWRQNDHEFRYYKIIGANSTLFITAATAVQTTPPTSVLSEGASPEPCLETSSLSSPSARCSSPSQSPPFVRASPCLLQTGRLSMPLP